MKIDVTSYITAPHTRFQYASISNELVDCKQTLREEFSHLNYGLRNFCHYENVTLEKEFSPGEVVIIHQEYCAVWALLTTDFRENDATLTRWKYNVVKDQHYLSTIVGANEWPFYKQKRYILAEREKKKVSKKLKESLAGDLYALFNDFMKVPHCYLPLQVSSYAAKFLEYKFNEIEAIFFSKLNSDSFEVENNPHFNRKPGRVNFWRTSWRNNHDYYHQVGKDYYQFAHNYQKNSISLIAEAVNLANESIDSETLVKYVDKQNPEEAPYNQRYTRITGKKPSEPQNRHTMTGIDDGLSTTGSTNENEMVYFEPAVATTGVPSKIMRLLKQSKSE